MLNIGIIGLGYWGPNLLRNFSNNSKCQVRALCDTNNSLLKKYKKTHTKQIGDYKASKCVVLPIKELFSEGCYSL